MCYSGRYERAESVTEAYRGRTKGVQHTVYVALRTAVQMRVNVRTLVKSRVKTVV